MFEQNGLFSIVARISGQDERGATGNIGGPAGIVRGIHAGGDFNIDFHDYRFVGLDGNFLRGEPSLGWCKPGDKIHLGETLHAILYLQRLFNLS